MSKWRDAFDMTNSISKFEHGDLQPARVWCGLCGTFQRCLSSGVLVSYRESWVTWQCTMMEGGYNWITWFAPTAAGARTSWVDCHGTTRRVKWSARAYTWFSKGSAINYCSEYTWEKWSRYSEKVTGRLLFMRSQLAGWDLIFHAINYHVYWRNGLLSLQLLTLLEYLSELSGDKWLNVTLMFMHCTPSWRISN